MEAGISSIGFTGRQDLHYQELFLNGSQKTTGIKSPEVMENSISKLIRMMGLGQNVDVKT